MPDLIYCFLGDKLMIYCCEKCRFIFSRSGEVENCPDCASPNVRHADEEETAEYKQRLEQPEKIWQ